MKVEEPELETPKMEESTRNKQVFEDTIEKICKEYDLKDFGK